MQLPKYNQGAGAPDVKPGLQRLRFDGLELKEHDDWAGTDRYGHPDNGKRFHFAFTLLDKKGAEVYGEDGDPVMLEALTRTATGEKSGFFAIFGGIATPSEIESFKTDTLTEKQSDAMLGREVHAKVALREKNNWPFVESVIGPVED